MKLLLATVLVSLCMCLTACSKEPTEKPDAQSSQKESGSGKGNDAKQQPGTVKIEPADQQKAGIQVAAVEVRSMPQLLTVPGQVVMDEQHTSHVGALADGRITAVMVLPGAVVHRGTVLAQLHSHTVHETVGALLQAFAARDRQRSAVTFAQQASDRYAHLYAIQAASLEEKQHSDQMLAQAHQDLADAEASVHMEREHLSELLQVAPESLTPNNLYDRELVPIRSPIDGVVVTRNVTVGQVVDTGFEAFAVSNLATVWVTASVNEKDIALVHKGAHANVVTQAYGETVFPASVAMVGDMLDTQTRTVPVRITVANAGMRLRPGMFATAHINGPGTRTALIIPEDALQDVNGNQVVFVTQDGSNFRTQIVRLGTRSNGHVEVVEGLKPGDRLAVNGAFMVKGELLKSTVGDG
jgi:cobalt-zinc-cadmium efflux system membrane fusion protein